MNKIKVDLVMRMNYNLIMFRMSRSKLILIPTMTNEFCSNRKK